MTADSSAPSALFQTVQRAFSKAGWKCSVVESDSQEVLRAGFEAHQGRVDLHAQAFAPVKTVAVVSEASIQVTPIRRSIVAELLMRNNQELTIGAFEMNWDTGSVYFRIANVFVSDSSEETAELIASLVRTNVVEMDRITPFLGEIEKTAEESLAGLDVARLMQRQDLLPQPPSNA